jgi:hypothetical protein
MIVKAGVLRLGDGDTDDDGDTDGLTELLPAVMSPPSQSSAVGVPLAALEYFMLAEPLPMSPSVVVRPPIVAPLRLTVMDVPETSRRTMSPSAHAVLSVPSEVNEPETTFPNSVPAAQHTTR